MRGGIYTAILNEEAIGIELPFLKTVQINRDKFPEAKESDQL